MTWIIPKNLHTSPFVQDTEELISDLNESSQICEQSLLVRSKPTRSRTWLQKWKRDSWTQLLYGRILRPSRGKSFAERWTSSLEASLVNPSQLRDVEEEMKILDTSSHISKGESLFSDLPLFSSRTSKGSSPLNSEKDGTTEQERPFSSMSSASWKGWVTKRRREYLARAKSAHLINERESLSWATPIKEDYKRRGPNSRQQGLPNQILMYSQVEEEKTKKNGSQKELSSKNWTTPNTGHYKTAVMSDQAIKNRIQAKRQECLLMQDYLIKPWSTPTGRDWKGTYSKSSQGKKYRNLLPDQAHQGTYKGQLNPRWVEALMGVPIGWTMATCANPYVIERTNSDSLETGSSLQQQREPFESFGENWATPNTLDHLSLRSDEALIKQATTTLKGRTKPPNLREQVDPCYCEKWDSINKKTPTRSESDKTTLLNQ